MTATRIRKVILSSIINKCSTITGNMWPGQSFINHKLMIPKGRAGWVALTITEIQINTVERRDGTQILYWNPNIPEGTCVPSCRPRQGEMYLFCSKESSKYLKSFIRRKYGATTLYENSWQGSWQLIMRFSWGTYLVAKAW